MEDIGSVVLLIASIGAIVLNVIASRNKAREQKSQQAPQHEEAWPTPTFPGTDPAPKAAPETPERHVFQPVMPVFPDECQSLEEIPAQEYTPEPEPVKTAGTGRFKTQPANRLTGGAETDEIAAHSLTNDTAAESATAVAEEFDLRRAVIYSEILKPKFED